MRLTSGNIISKTVKSKQVAATCDARESSDEGSRETYGAREKGLPLWVSSDCDRGGDLPENTDGMIEVERARHCHPAERSRPTVSVVDVAAVVLHAAAADV